MAEISGRSSTQRWKPTEEQLQILEALYINVSSKPNREQIDHIADLLKTYGDLQAKNVYYWFQNRRGKDRHKRRGRLEETMTSTMFKAAKTRTEWRIGKYWQKMEPLTINETFKGLTTLKQNSSINQETNIKEKCCTGGKQIDNYKYEDIEIAHPANKIIGRSSWALSGIEARVEPSRLPKCGGFKEPNKPLQTLQLFPLTPNTIKYTDDNVLDSNCSAIRI